MAKHIVLAVTNDLVTDQRVHKIASSLSEDGYTVSLIGRLRRGSKPLLPRKYRCIRMRLLFEKGMLFYAEYNLRLFVQLIRMRANMVTANDLDTLPGAWLASAVLRARLVYDSHEYFTEVPELASRPAVRRIWEYIEARLVPRADAHMTVCQSIADIYEGKFGRKFAVVRNLPFRSDFPLISNDSATKTIIYQGAVNIGRGLELMLDAMLLIADAHLLIVGDGDMLPRMRELVVSKGLRDKVTCTGQVPFEALRSYTLKADLGISLEENIGLNYYYALPNKLFDYIQCSVPVLVSDLPEMRRIVSQYGVGRILAERSPESLARMATDMLTDKTDRLGWKENAHLASKELCWDSEKQIVLHIYRQQG